MKDEIKKLVDELYEEYKKNSIEKVNDSITKVDAFIRNLYEKLCSGEQPRTTTDAKGNVSTKSKAEVLSERVHDSIGYMFAEAGRDMNICGLFIPYCIHRGMKKEEFVKYLKNPDNADISGTLDILVGDFKKWIFSDDKEMKLDVAKKVYADYLKTVVNEIGTLKTEYKENQPEFYENNCIYMSTYSSLQQTLFKGGRIETEVYKIAPYVDEEFKKIGIEDGFNKARDVAIQYHSNFNGVQGMLINLKRLKQAEQVYNDSPNDYMLEDEYMSAVEAYKSSEFGASQQRMMSLKTMDKWGSTVSAFNKNVTFGDFSKASLLSGMSSAEYRIKNANVNSPKAEVSEQASKDLEEMNNVVRVAYLRDYKTANLVDKLSNNIKLNIFKKPVAHSDDYNDVLNSLKKLNDLEAKGSPENMLNVVRREVLANCNKYMSKKNPGSKQGKERYALVAFTKEITEAKLAENPFYSKVRIPDDKTVNVRNNFEQKLLFERIKKFANSILEAKKNNQPCDLVKCIAEIYVAQLGITKIEKDKNYNYVNWKTYDSGVKKCMELEYVKEYCQNFDMKIIEKHQNFNRLGEAIVEGINMIAISKKADVSVQNLDREKAEVEIAKHGEEVFNKFIRA